MTSCVTNVSCLVCCKVCISESELLVHMQTHLKQENSCPFCPFSSVEVDILQEHVIISHAEDLKTPTKSILNLMQKPLLQGKTRVAFVQRGSWDPYSSNAPREVHWEMIWNSYSTGFDHGTNDQPGCSATTSNQNIPVCPLCEKFCISQLEDHICTDCSVSIEDLKDFDHVENVPNTHQVIVDHMETENDISKSDHMLNSTCAMQLVDTSYDLLLAKQIEADEIKRMHEEKLKRQKAEEAHFKLLQKKHNIFPHDKQNFKTQSLRNMEKAVGRGQLGVNEYFSGRFKMMENLEVGLDDLSTCSSSIINVLCKKLEKRLRPDVEVWISSHASHFGRGYGDSGWGCGYRNLQMLLSSLIPLPQYKNTLQRFEGGIPSIPKLQQMIENAWSSGFDAKGCQQLDGKLVKTRKWIGATEVFSLLCSVGLQCTITDFHRFSDNAGKSHPLLLNWVEKYFINHSMRATAAENSLFKRDLPLLYIQHQGHSRSIAGLQFNKKLKRVTHLIVLDPSHSKNQISSSLRNDAWKPSSMVLKTPSSFTKSQYQIVAVNGIATKEVFESQKFVENLSERIP